MREAYQMAINDRQRLIGKEKVLTIARAISKQKNNLAEYID